MAIDYTKNAVTGQPLTPYQMSFDPGNQAATSPAKSQYVASKVATPTKTTTPPVTTPQTQYTTPSGAGYNTATGVTTPPPVDPNAPPAPSAADTAFASYLTALQQPQEVTDATKYVNNLITQGKQDQEKALGTGETLGFATGEAARVGRQNALTLEAAGRGLDALIASNASKKEIAKARYDYEKAKVDAKTASDKANTAPFELSPGQERYTFNPKTGKYEKTASAPPTPTKVTAADQKAVLSSDVNQAVDQLGKIVKAKGFRGVSPDDYNQMRSYLQDTYGVDGVIELDKAMKALGLTVDTDWQKLDAKNK
jgi:hypothetical protein